VARIIIAEDDDVVGEIAQDALIEAGHGVGVIADGLTALRVIRAKKPDLVILDCNLPGLSGVLVLREMRNSLKLFDTPVLMLTGRTSPKDEELALYEGANSYMKKPFDPEELKFRVGEMLKAPKQTPAAKSGHAR
jgi:DNA-binding response OmpR family regulator